MTGSYSTDHPSNDSDNDPSVSPACRICQSTLLECPDMPLIRPCYCNGSLAYVHVECLNQWRSTSAFAQSTCSVCNFKYKTKPKPSYSSFVSHHYFFLAASILATAMTIFLIGSVCVNIPISTTKLNGSTTYSFGLPNLIRLWFGMKAFVNCDDPILRNFHRYDDPFELSFESLFLHAFKQWYVTLCMPFNQLLLDISLVGHVTLSFLTCIFITLPKFYAARREPLDQNQLISIFLILATLSQSIDYTLMAICWHGSATFVKIVYTSIETHIRGHLSGLEEVISVPDKIAD